LENEPTLKTLVPLTLLQMGEKKVQILKNSGLWTASKTSSIMALKTQFDQQQAIHQQSPHYNNQKLVQLACFEAT